MSKFLKQLSHNLLCALSLALLSYSLSARSWRSFGKTKTYTKKAPYAGYGKVSPANGRIKMKGTAGHMKKTSKGYTHVNPYSRSK